MGIVIIGPSGSGKGTQAELLSKKRGWDHVSSGALAREEIEKKTEVGGKLANYVNNGKWVPNDLILELLEKRLSEVKGDFIVDGTPRLEAQIEPFEAVVARVGKKIDKVIYLWISDEEAVRRLSARLTCPVDGEIYNLITRPPKEGEKCDNHGVVMTRRDDDQPEAIRSRLAEFHRTIAPVLEYYRNKGKLIEVNGERSIEEIHKEMATLV